MRAGQAQCSVAASFLPPAGHPALALLEEQGIESEDDALVLRRVVQADGRSRAFLNDQPVGRRACCAGVAATLVEVQGQHDQVGLADPATHAGAARRLRRPRRQARRRRRRLRRLARRRARAGRGARGHRGGAARRGVPPPRRRGALRPRAGGGRGGGAVARAPDACSRASGAPRSSPARWPRCSRATAAAAARPTRCAAPPARWSACRRRTTEAQPILALLGTAQDAVAEAETLLERLLQEGGPDPRRLETLEDRLFGLRAAARKHSVAVVELPALLEQPQGAARRARRRHRARRRAGSGGAGRRATPTSRPAARFPRRGARRPSDWKRRSPRSCRRSSSTARASWWRSPRARSPAGGRTASTASPSSSPPTPARRRGGWRRSPRAASCRG